MRVAASDQMAGPVDAILRRLILQCGRDLTATQDQIDCADLLLLVGHGDAARLIVSAVFVRSGFSSSRLRRQAVIAAKHDLWDGLDAADFAINQPAASTFSIDHAIADLELLFATPPQMEIPDTHLKSHLDETAPKPAKSASLFNGCPTDAMFEDMQRICGQLLGALRSSPSDVVWNNLSTLLAEARDNMLNRSAFNLDDHIGDPIDRLVARLTFNSIRWFLFTNYDLAFAPYGSAAVFHQAARLEEGGLGPYCRNTGNLIRNVRDIIGLIQLAAKKLLLHDVQPTLLERWCVILSLHLNDQATHDFLEELGDAGLMKPVWGTLSRIMRRTEPLENRRLLWCIRDIGLDQGDFELASRAQEMITLWWPDDKTEWIILGDVKLTAERSDDAERVFLQVLSLEPNHQDARDRIAALRESRANRYHLSGGFGSSATRKRVREKTRTIGRPDPKHPVPMMKRRLDVIA